MPLTNAIDAGENAIPILTLGIVEERHLFLTG